MAKGLFQSPKKALLFVGMTMFSVAMLVGSEDDEGALVQAAASLEQEPDYTRDVQPFSPPPQRREREWGDDDSSAFTPEEDLVDNAQGFDPTPDPVEAYEPETNLGASNTQVVEVDAGSSAEVQF